MRNSIRRSLLLLVAALCALPASAATVEYHLTLAEKIVNFTGTPVRAMAVNGSIPAPVLRFREGDWARIRVTNAMHMPSSIHWHGILVPNRMDGVPFLTYPPIAPGATFTYESASCRRARIGITRTPCSRNSADFTARS